MFTLLGFCAAEYFGIYNWVFIILVMQDFCFMGYMAQHHLKGDK